MSSKYLPAAFIAVILAIGAAVWFWVTSPAPLETPVAEAPPPALPPEEPDNFPPLPEVAVAAPAPAPVPAPAPAFDPQAELGTAIQDFARLAQSGDMLALMQTYMTPDEQARMGPEQMAEMQAMMQGPMGAMMTQVMVAEMQFIQNQTPTYDETGNRATFARPAGSPGGDIKFVKVNGRWYRE